MRVTIESKGQTFNIKVELTLEDEVKLDSIASESGDSIETFLQDLVLITIQAMLETF